MFKHLFYSILFFAMFAVLFSISCAPRLSQHFLQESEIRRIPTEFVEVNSSAPKARFNRRGPCFDNGAYIPDTSYLDHTPIKYIRINLHWMQPSEPLADFSEEKAIEFSHGIMKTCNYAMTNNKSMWLPHNNDTPTLPTRIRYVLSPRPDDPNDDGIYFHYDDDHFYYIAKGKNRNLYDREVGNKYGVQLDTVLNFFFMLHHPDSIRSKTYKAVGTGVALGNVIKWAGINPNQDDFWGYRGSLNHEVGHIFGLSHTWAYNDGCDDTPRHRQNCWNRSQPGCDTTTSNNVMDYNALQLAWSPCQIGKVHQRMSDLKANARKLLVPNWCILDEDKTIIIKDTVSWEGAHDLEGNLVIDSEGQLLIKCRVSIPPGGKITVKAGGTLILDGAQLHNACGQEWEGIEVEELNGETGIVQFMKEPIFEQMRNTINN